MREVFVNSKKGKMNSIIVNIFTPNRTRIQGGVIPPP